MGYSMSAKITFVLMVKGVPEGWEGVEAVESK